MQLLYSSRKRKREVTVKSFQIIGIYHSKTWRSFAVVDSSESNIYLE